MRLKQIHLKIKSSDQCFLFRVWSAIHNKK